MTNFYKILIIFSENSAIEGVAMKNQEKFNRFKAFNRKHLPKILYIIVMAGFILPIIYIVLMMIFGNAETNAAGYHSRADYALMLVECVLGLVVIHIPSFLEKRLRFELPTVLYILYMVFLYCSITLGEVRSFYYTVPHWDVFLHAFSSVMTGLFGYMLVTILNRDEKLLFRLSPFFVAMFAFCFSVMIGSVWEVYEFTVDGLLNLNMQKHTLSDGTALVGHEALLDTMKDIIVDICGALIASVIGYISLKNDRHWLSFTLKKDAQEP